jgi:guanylate kinase
MRRGILYVISAPSGTGKTTLLKRVMADFQQIRFSVSYTTRPPRSGEKDGVDYYFVSHDAFKKMVHEKAFVEWAEVLGNHYGTSRKFLEDCRSRGADVILDIDTQGAAQIRSKYSDGVFIFILPPGIEDLKRRLIGRGSESHESVDLRLRNASKEMERIGCYDYVVINDRVDDAIEKLKAIIVAEKCRRHRVLDQPKDC